MATNVYPLLAAERTTFADYLKTLAAADWDKPSLCEGWTVKDVAAHVTNGAALTPAKFLTGLIGAGFSIARWNANGIAQETKGSTEELVARLSTRASNKTIPGLAMLGETVTHAEDIRAALGGPAIAHSPEALKAVAGHFAKSPAPIGGKKRTAGLSLESTDVTWTTGSGPLVRGPLVSLILAISGRKAGLVDLSGPGLEAFSSRI